MLDKLEFIEKIRGSSRAIADPDECPAERVETDDKGTC